jgi:hypothetical protein
MAISSGQRTLAPLVQEMGVDGSSNDGWDAAEPRLKTFRFYRSQIQTIR